MADTIASNIIVKSRLAAPTGDGLKKVREELVTIYDLMTRINSQGVKINVDITGGKEAIASLRDISVVAANNLRKARAAAGRDLGSSHANQGVRVGPVRGPSSGLMVRPPVALSSGGTIPPFVSSGNSGGGGAGNTGSSGINTGNRTGGGGGGTTFVPPNFQGGFGTTYRTSHTVSPTGETEAYDVYGTRRQGNVRHENVQRYRPNEETGALEASNATQNTYNEQAQRAAARAKKLTALQDTTAYSVEDQVRKHSERVAYGEQLAGRGQSAGLNVSRSGQTTLPTADPAIRLRTEMLTFTKELADGSKKVREYNQATGKLTPSRTIPAEQFGPHLPRGGTTAQRAADSEATQIAKVNANAMRATHTEADLLANGYRKVRDETKGFSIGQTHLNETITEFHKVTGSALTKDLSLEIAKVSTKTGEMTQRTLDGSRAMRYLGDSFTNVLSRLGTWFAAGAAILFFTKTLGEAARQFQALEANTIFLARVGNGLGENFQERLSEARLLTVGITELSAATGIDAVESQKAAAVFLRAGQTRVEALQSTKVAMIASKVAELDVEEAAKLLSSAQMQFNLSSRQLLPTLDSLNTLSNRYVVSTNDLLQSISRAGKVYSDANGSLQGLAATTAIIVQATRRSGAEVGNAIKTIQSRLASPDVGNTLMDRVGVSMYDAEGKAKNLTQVLFELQTAMTGLTTSQKDQLSVTIGGIRQVNTLRTAIGSVADIAIAEAQSLRDSNSASKEAMEASTTLQSALGRLRGEFSGLVNTVSNSASGGIVTSIANTIALILKLMNSFDGLFLRISTYLVILGVVYYAMVRFNTQLTAIATSGAVAIAALNGIGASGGIAAAGLISAANGARALGVALTTGTLGTALLVTAAIFALSYAIDWLAQKFASSTIENDKFSTVANEATSAAQREEKAVLGLANAISEQEEAIRRLQAAKNADPKEVNRIQGGLDRLKKEAALGVSPAQAKQNTLDRINEESKAEQEAMEKAQAAKAPTGNYNSMSEERLSSRLQMYKDIEKKNGGNYIFRVKNKEDQERTGMPISKLKTHDTSTEIEHINAEIKARRELAKEIQTHRTRLMELATTRAQVEKTQVNDPTTDEAQKLTAAGKAAMNAYKAYDLLHAAEEKLSHGLGYRAETASMTQKQNELLAEQATLIKSIGVMTDGPEKEKAIEIANKYSDAIERINIKQSQLKINTLKEYFSSAFETNDNIEQAVASHGARMNFIQDDHLGKGKQKSLKQFEQYDAIKAEIEASKQLAKQRMEAEQKGLKGHSNEDKIAYQESQRIQIAKLLKQAKEGEVKALVELFKIEEEVTKEKIKQNREAAKAAGLLSDEDKIRLLSMQSYLDKNPNKEINKQDFFFMPQDQARLANQFQQGKMNFDSSNPSNKQFQDRFLGGENFGVDRDVLEAQKRLQDQGLGPNATDADRRALADKARNRTGEISQIENPGFQNPNKFDDVKKIDITNPITAKDFQPLVDTFEDIVAKELLSVRNDMIKDLQNIWSTLRDAQIDRRGLPPISQQ